MSQITPEGISEEEYLALCLEYNLWFMEGACAHERMSIASERISNWAGLREFQQALHTVGQTRFPTLLGEIPDGNGGSTTPGAARECLEELNLFCSLDQCGILVELVDGSTGAAIHSYVGPYDGWLSTDGKTNISFRLDSDGTFQVERGQMGLIRHDPNAQILFRSRAFSQAKTSEGGFRFTDLATGEQIVVSGGIGRNSGTYPTSLKVRWGTDTPARYTYCTEPLRRVFQAAIDTNHPVLWM